MKRKLSIITTMMAAVLAAAALVSPFAVYAATGTVTGSDINVRSEASTSGNVVGTVSSGDSLTVGDSTTDSSGATWYAVTLSDGTSGYIRGDFLTVEEDEEETEESTEETETSDSTDDAATDEAVTDATSAADADTGGYQIVLAPDEDGNETYYLYDNNAGERMKISDISELQDAVNEANQNVADTKTKYTIYLIVLIVAVVVLIIAVIVLVLKLRDALANGRRERDLTMERRDQRRSNRNADSVEALRKPRGGQSQTGSSRTGRGREDAYASGASRRLEREEGSTSRESDPYAGTASRSRTISSSSRESSRPASRESAARDARSQSYSSSEDSYRSGSAQTGSSRQTQTTEGTARRSSSRASQETGSRAGGESGASATGAQGTASSSRRSQARNFADDDFDYDFLKLDDSDQ